MYNNLFDKKNVKIFIIILLIIVLLSVCFIFASCNRSLSDEDLRIKNIIDPITENYFLSINAKDYDKFSKDFDNGMKKAVTEDNFTQLISQISGLGEYVPGSIKLIDVAREQGFTAAYYTLNFSAKNNVRVKMVFSVINDEYKISGQWFQ